MTRPSRVAALVLLLAVVLLAGCGGDEGDEAIPDVTPRPELVAQADLDPCPASSSESTDDGLPDLTLPCLGEGPAVHLSGLRGRPTVVNIWGSWCRPCQDEAPILNRAYADLAHRVRFLGIDTVDDPNSALDFAVHIEPPMRYPSVVDDDKRALIAIGGSQGPPMTVFVDDTGRVVHRSFGEYRSDEQLRADIAKYLGVSA
jgi:cytochrome c biogenesis protein CcmG, thiol:disulfide interchange protein DsbE